MNLSSSVMASIVAAFMTGPALLQDPAPAAPVRSETFHIVATQTTGSQAEGSVTVKMVIRLNRYTPEHARTVMTDALKYNGYPGFLNALREAPAVGTLSVAGQSFTIRWARQEPAGAGRTITIVTDKPVFFVGGGRQGAKRTAGYEVAVILLNVDEHGGGDGTMAAAARVRPKDVTGIQVDNYAEKPLQLTIATPAAK